MYFYGVPVFSETVRLAEKIANGRHFIMKYDYETPVHDIIGRQKGIKRICRLNRTNIGYESPSFDLFWKQENLNGSA
jgi:hypothetical protein